jgi:hypothetical protein
MRDSSSCSPGFNTVLARGGYLISLIDHATLSNGVPKASPLLNVGGVRGDGQTVRGGRRSLRCVGCLHRRSREPSFAIVNCAPAIEFLTAKEKWFRGYV